MKTSFILLILINLTLSLQAQNVTLKAYNNYDFIAGDNLIFEDNFTSGIVGEFPPNWKLIAGQGVVNTLDGENVFIITEGSYGKVAPRIKTSNYLSQTFTIECDYLSLNNDEYGLSIFFAEESGEDSKAIMFSPLGNVETEYFFEIPLKGTHPEAETGSPGKWRHVAIAYKNGQMKCYVDQYRVLFIPDCGFIPKEVRFGGNAPNRFKNVKIANGGGMNMIDQINKDGKLITHGILFDVNKSTIKPSSMGILNEIVKMMKEHPELKLQIEGHTDSDGDDAFNLKLSLDRADAVKTQLVSMGIENTKLTTKGYGETKPISPNTTPEGKANNRRVEFVKF